MYVAFLRLAFSSFFNYPCIANSVSISLLYFLRPFSALDSSWYWEFRRKHDFPICGFTSWVSRISRSLWGQSYLLALKSLINDRPGCFWYISSEIMSTSLIHRMLFLLSFLKKIYFKLQSNLLSACYILWRGCHLLIFIFLTAFYFVRLRWINNILCSCYLISRIY